MCGRISRLDRGVNGPWARIRSCSRQRGAAMSPWSRRSSASERRGVVHWQGGCHRSRLDTLADRCLSSSPGSCVCSPFRSLLSKLCVIMIRRPTSRRESRRHGHEPSSSSRAFDYRTAVARRRAHFDVLRFASRR